MSPSWARRVRESRRSCTSWAAWMCRPREPTGWPARTSAAWLSLPGLVRNRRIGFVFQQFNLLASLTAWRNVELPLTYAGVGRTERRERAIEALERVGFGDRIQHRPGELSGGQQQRVAIARALVSEPDLILADEPTGALDSKSAHDIMVLLDELHTAGRTLVLITHDAEVAGVAQRTIRIRDGLVAPVTELAS